ARDAADLVIGEQLGDVERHAARGGRRLDLALPFPPRPGPLALELEGGRLQLPRCGGAHLGAATQEDEVIGVTESRLPLLEVHAAAALAEVPPLAAIAEAPIAAPRDVPAAIDDEREAPQARRRAAGQVCIRQIREPRDRIPPVDAGLD